MIECNPQNLTHPFYRLMEMDIYTLNLTLDQMSRLELIDWLEWNDRNGVYNDKQSMAEFGNILSKEEAISIIVKQITQ